MSEEIGNTIEDQTLHDVLEGIQKQQYQYLIEEAGTFYEYDGIDSTGRAAEELRINDYGRIPDDSEPSALWIFNHETAYEVIDDIDAVGFRPGPRELHGYPIHESHAMPKDRFVIVDIEALAPNRSRKQPITEYSPSDQFNLTVPRPWLVKDPMGVCVVEYPNA